MRRMGLLKLSLQRIDKLAFNFDLLSWFAVILVVTIDRTADRFLHSSVAQGTKTDRGIKDTGNKCPKFVEKMKTVLSKGHEKAKR